MKYEKKEKTIFPECVKLHLTNIHTITIIYSVGKSFFYLIKSFAETEIPGKEIWNIRYSAFGEGSPIARAVCMPIRADVIITLSLIHYNRIDTVWRITNRQKTL